MTNLLLDQGLPRRAAADLRARGWSVEHVGEIGFAAAPDEEILGYAATGNMAVVTLDNDFTRLVAVPQRSAPSLIHVRVTLRSPNLLRWAPACCPCRESAVARFLAG